MTVSDSSRYTDQQESAIRYRQGAVSLAAGAGCGKTFVLTERFLSELDPDRSGAGRKIELHQLLAITFTDAAAREMRDRIRGKCYERLVQAEEGREAHWLRLLREMESARISTIHSLCTSLLRAHAVELGLDPTFEVLPQGDADVLLSGVIDDVLRRGLAERDENVLDLAATFDLGPLKGHVTSLVSAWREAEFGVWSGFSVEQVLDRWEEVLDRDVLPAAVKKVVSSPHSRQIVSLLKEVTPGNERFAQAREELLSLLDQHGDAGCGDQEALSGDRDFSVVLDLILTNARVDKMRCSKDWDSDEKYESYKKSCEKVRNSIKEISKKVAPIDRELARPAARLGLELMHLAGRVRAEYAKLKSELGQLDFDDLLAHAHLLLQSPDFAEARQGIVAGLRRVLVDEFQDTDQLQVDLVKALCGGSEDLEKLFFVGDFKQSIYRFRGAQPEVFHSLRDQVGRAGRLPLTVNFRSQPAILNFVNALFCDAFAEYDPLLPHLQQTTPEPCVEFLWTQTPEKNRQKRGNADAARQQEARRIAARLSEMLDNGEPLIVDRPKNATEASGPATRPLKLGDIAILFRALSDVRHYEAALREYGLDYYLVGGHGFYAQQEIYDVLHLLRSIASSCDEISLAGVLRSPFFGLADEALFWIVEQSGGLNAALEAGAVPPELVPGERAKLRRAWDVLHELRERKESLSISEVLLLALDRTGYDAVLCTEFLGERKLANLQKLVEQARAADKGGLIDLNGFITQLAEFVAREPKEAPAATCPESANVIRLMTIHHAKGLEFPLVVVPDLDRRPRTGSNHAVFHPGLGPLVKDPNYDGTTGSALYGILDAAAEAEERTRLLYVACTRAADYLILSSSLADFDKPISDWVQLLAERFDLRTGQLIGSLPDGYETPRVLVTGEGPARGKVPAGAGRRTSLVDLMADAERLAAAGGGRRPAEVAPIPANLGARREFSFSRLTGDMAAFDELEHAQSGEEAAPHPATFEPSPAVPLGGVLPGTAGGTQSTDIDALGLGLLVHDVMQRVEFGAEHPLSDWCRDLAETYCPLQAERAGELALDLVTRFCRSPRAGALASAAEVHRELEFLLAWPPAAAASSPQAALLQGEGFCLRGFIDCLYQSADGSWRVVDYKTNQVSPDAVAEAAARYELQLGVYALAVEQALGQSPSELVLHFLRPGVEHVFPWGDSQRRSVIERVSRAMLRCTGRSVDAA